MVEASVDTAGRYASGVKDFQEWLGSLPAHRGEFERHFNEYELAEDDVGRLERALESVGGPVRSLIVTNPKTADDWRGVAVMAKIAEVTGIELSIVPADGNEDILESHRNAFDDSGTPTIVFLDEDGETLGHLSKGPQQVEMDINRAIEEQHGIEFPLEGPEYEAAVTEYLAGDGRQREKAWRHAQLWETISAISPEVARASRGTIGPIGFLRHR